MDQLVGFLLHPPLSEIGEKFRKMLKYTPQFQSAFVTAVIQYTLTNYRVHYIVYTIQYTL